MSAPVELPAVRSALYVPGHRADFLAKADQRGADAVIVDLEDSVADRARDDALATTRDWIEHRTDPTAPVVCVRVNAVDTGRLEQDLGAIVHRNLTAVVVPKVEQAEDVRIVDRALGYAEGAAGLPHGSIRIWPLIETATAVQRADAVATSSTRIAFMGGAAADNGDLAKALGFRWTPDAAETHYLRSKVLVDVRAAGVPNPMTGMVVAVDRLDEVESFARQSRSLGYEGMMVIHPSHVAIVNEVFTPSEREVEAARGLIAALTEAEARGDAAVTFNGQMVDTAMVAVAQRLIARYERLAAG